MSIAASLDILVRANTSQATAALAKTQGQLKQTTATSNTTSAAIGKKLATAAKVGALGLAAIGAYSVKAAADFEESMRNVNSIAQLNEKQFKSLGNEVQKLAGKTAQSPKTLAEGLYDLVSSGFDARESMKVLASSARAATAGLTDTATSTKAVAAVLNAYRLPANKAASVSDTLFKTVDQGVVSFEELSSVIGDVLPFASSLGIKLEEVGAATSTMTKAGISPSETMTRLKAAMSALIKPSTDLTATLQEMGYESGEALVQQEGFQGALEALAKTTGGSKEELAKLFPNIRALGAALALTGKNTQGAEADLRNFNDTSGATKKALEEQKKSTAYVWRNFQVDVQNAAIDLGEKLLPELQSVMKILKNPNLKLDEKVAKLGDKLSDMIAEWAPKIAEAGVKIGFAITKGIAQAFIEGNLLTKLFIGAAALKLFGGTAALSALGTSLGTPVGLAMATAIAAYAGTEFAKSDFVKDIFQMTDVLEHAMENSADLTEEQIQRAVEITEAGGQKITKNTVWMWQRNHEISAEGAHKFLAVIEKMDNRTEVAFKLLGAWMDFGGDSVKDFTSLASDKLRGYAALSEKQMEKVSNALKDPMMKAFERASDKVKDFTSDASDRLSDFARDADKSTEKTGKSFDKLGDKSGAMKAKVGANIMNLARTVTGGLGIIVDNTNKALKGFGVKKVAITLSNVGDAAKGFQTGGVIVPGQGNGDKVPAMLEPGEVVWNKKAVAAMGGAQKANQVNSLVPRFQKGGVMGPMVALANKYERASYPYLWGGGHGGFVNASSPVDCSGAVSDILHAGGLLNGAPMVSGALMNWGKPAKGNEPVVVYANPGHTVMSLNGKTFGTSGTNPGGGAGWIEGGNGASLAPGAKRTMDVVGGILNKIKRVLLDGPDGPLKSMGQGALDKSWKAANAFLSKQMPKGSTGGGDLGPLGKNAVVGKATWFTGGTMASGKNTDIHPGLALNPNPGGPDPQSWNNPTTQGWLSSAQRFLVELGGKKAVLPVLDMGPAGWTGNAIDVDLAGVKELGYSTSNFPSGTVGKATPLKAQLGGIIQKFKGGTKGKGVSKGKGELSGKGEVDGIGSVSTYDTMPLIKAQRIRDKIAALIGETGTIAKLQDKINVTEWMHGLSSSEMGADLGRGEIRKQVGLLQERLAFESRVAELARVGMRWTHRGMKNAPKGKKAQLGELRSAFASNLLDFTGASGKTGKIWDTKTAIFDLLGTKIDTATDTKPTMDISGLRSVIEAAQYGTFAGMFAKGGHIPAGKWGIAGERGPEPVAGPATVLPNSALKPAVNVTNNFSFDEFGMLAETFVDDVLVKRERIEHHKARQFAQ